MPKQISKSIAVFLLNEEVEVWNALERYALRRRLSVISQTGTGKVSTQRMMRVILRLAAERVAEDVGGIMAKKLAAARPFTQRGRPAKLSRARPAKPAVRAARSVKKSPQKPTRRIHWDRPWKEPHGGE